MISLSGPQDSRLKKDEFVPLLWWDSLTCMKTSLVDCILFSSLISGPFATSFQSSSCVVWHNSAYSHCWQPPDHLHPLWSDVGKQNMEQLDTISQVSCTVAADLFPISYDTFCLHLALRLSPFGPVSSNLQRTSGTARLHVASLCLFGNHLFLCKNPINDKISVIF